MMMTTPRLRELLQEYSHEALVDMFTFTVKKHPANREARNALAALWCLEGQWDKALQQAEILVKVDDTNTYQGELLKNLILSEMVRNQVLAGERPAAPLEAHSIAWCDLLHQANQALGQDDLAQSDALRADAFNQASERAGTGIQTGDFSWIADCDGRLGPVCEFICAGGYRWVPFEQIQSIKITRPQTLLNLIWIPATVSVNERVWNGFLPARYPLVEGVSEHCKLGDETRWTPVSDMLTVGNGRKMWLTDSRDFSILDIDEVIFR